MLNAVDSIAARRGLPREQSLADVDFLCHGTTAALNALVTGNVARVGLLTTKGHRDSIYIMKIEGRYAGLGAAAAPERIQYSQTAATHTQTTDARSLERIDYAGRVVVPLDENGARQAVRELLHEGVDAIAMSLLWSFTNPEHEQTLRQIMEAEARGFAQEREE